MKVLLVGTGGVGEAIAVVAQHQPWLERMVLADNETCMQRYGVQAVVWQTAINPVIAMELLSEGVWQGRGVLGPEAFDPDPFVERMPKYDFPLGMKEMG